MGDIAKKSAELTTPAGGWGSGVVSNKDILIPRILLMQGLSELVGEGKAGQGDLVRSTNKQILAKKGEAVSFLPLRWFKTWILNEKVGNKFEYRGEIPMTISNEGDPWEYTAPSSSSGTGIVQTEWRRDQAINLYVLLTTDTIRFKQAKELAAKGQMPSPEDALLPCVVSFRRTGYKTGKQMLTAFKMCEQFNIPAFAATYKLSSKLEKSDGNTYHLLQVEQAGQTPDDQKEPAALWFNLLSDASNVQVDAAEDVGAARTAAQPVSGTENF